MLLLYTYAYFCFETYYDGRVLYKIELNSNPKSFRVHYSIRTIRSEGIAGIRIQQTRAYNKCYIVLLYFETRSVFELHRKPPWDLVGEDRGRCGSEFHTTEIQKFQTIDTHHTACIHRLETRPFRTPDDRKISRIDIFYKGFVYNQLHFVVFSLIFFFLPKIGIRVYDKIVPRATAFQRLGEFMAVNRSALVVYPNAIYTRDGITCKTVVDLYTYIYYVYYITRTGESCTSLLCIYIYYPCNMYTFIFIFRSTGQYRKIRYIHIKKKKSKNLPNEKLSSSVP